MIPMRYSEARGTLIYEKNLKSKISCQTPFKDHRLGGHHLPSVPLPAYCLVVLELAGGGEGRGTRGFI